MNYRAPIRFGVVGTGYAAQRRLDALVADDRAEVVLLSGHTPEKTQTIADKYGGLKTRPWMELVQSEQVDVVVIGNVNSQHGPVARAALNAGKHVVVEYPLCFEPEDAIALIALAQEKQRLLHIEHIELLGSLHQTLGAHLEAIGEPVYARYTTITPQRPVPSRRWTFNRDLFGFPLVAALSRLHRFTNLFGPVATVSAQHREWHNATMQSPYFSACLTQAQLRFETGLQADITYGKGEIFWQGYRDFELHGDRGSISFYGAEGTLRTSEGEKSITLPSRRGLFTQDTQQVLAHLLDPAQPLYVRTSSSLQALTVATAAQQSALTGQTVKVKELSAPR
ncbi:MAG: Gfo/Idh/MocA family oxidoreductase [Cyanobacteria bacterium P01_H01_bin.15]